MSGNKRVDRLASIASVAGTFTVDEIEIAKKIYVRMLTDDTSTTELEGTRMTEFEIKCGSRRECLRGKKKSYELITSVTGEFASTRIC